MSSSERPLCVIGRQHSGNIMLATGRHPDAYAFTGEGTFFEHRASIETLTGPRTRVVEAVAEGGDPPLDQDARNRLLRQLQDSGATGSAVDVYS